MKNFRVPAKRRRSVLSPKEEQALRDRERALIERLVDLFVEMYRPALEELGRT